MEEFAKAGREFREKIFRNTKKSLDNDVYKFFGCDKYKREKNYDEVDMYNFNSLTEWLVDSDIDLVESNRCVEYVIKSEDISKSFIKNSAYYKWEKRARDITRENRRFRLERNYEE